MIILPKNYKKILVIELAFIGDMLLTTPVLRGLRATYPHAKITLLTLPQVAPLAMAVPFIDDVLIYDKKGRDKGFFAIFSIAKRLRPYNFDLSVCMNFAIRGAVVSFLAGIPERLGYDTRHAGLFLTLKASAKRDSIVHESENQLAILKPLHLSVSDTSLALVPQKAMQNTYEF